MAFGKDVYTAVNAEFSRRREQALTTQSRRKEEVFPKNPRFLQIENLLKTTSMELAAKIASGANMELSALEIQKKNQALLQERGEILIRAGYQPNYLDLQFTCASCADTGFVGSRMCACYKKALNDVAFENSILAKAMPEARFENFDLGFYSREPDETGISPRDRMVLVLEACEGFCHNFGEQRRSLLFQGPTGLGKTFLCGCISRELTARGKIVVYDSAYALFSRMEKEKFFHEGSVDNSDLLECDLLIMDDLGAEMQTAFTRSALYNLINTRLLRNKLTIINTNYTMTELEKIYTPRITSRLIGEYTMMKFSGEDIRQQKMRAL